MFVISAPVDPSGKAFLSENFFNLFSTSTKELGAVKTQWCRFRSTHDNLAVRRAYIRVKANHRNHLFNKG